MIHKVSTEKHPFKKIKTIGSIVFYFNEVDCKDFFENELKNEK